MHLADDQETLTRVSHGFKSVLTESPVPSAEREQCSESSKGGKMRLETKIQKHIHDNGWYVNYDGHHATNIFGTEYSVRTACAGGYADLSSVRYGSKQITLR